MCTVTFVIEKKGQIIITSSRDEQSTRPQALKPQKILLNEKNILFPKDEKAGGTWFVVDELGNALVLLNGGFEPHIQQKTYRKSRGLIVLDIFAEKNILLTFDEIDLEDIEPFTLILWTKENFLYELIWDGIAKYSQILDHKKPHIYSSVTLYKPEIRAKRKKWFESFLEQNKQISASLLQKFHTTTQTNDTENGLVINRNNQVKTYSVTQVTIDDKKINMVHQDLLAQKTYDEEFTLIFS
ncbi:MAG: hypothetical protein EAZ85_11405 [Bacteroidetes bacterium]|nr:MAG: hypothetical protein EAZ85_11405 [Bacteroidota bacterium]TAG92189.1 MAG: hypothetical protein EAZ20_02700 [Bacteroidota bacterium]